MHLSQEHLASLAELTAYRPGEALFRPSSVSRVIACPGSVRLGRFLEKPSIPTIPQAEGTTAHHIAYEALTNVRQPEEWIGRIYSVDEFGVVKIPVTEEMVRHVELYLSVVRSYAQRGYFAPELPLTLGALDPTNPVLAQNKGTADAVILDYDNGEITIIDLKYGKGHMVPATTPQLTDYGAMAFVTFKPPPTGWKIIRQIIVQPRSSNLKEVVKLHEYSAADITDFIGKIYRVFLRALEPEQVLNAGDHCDWCPAKSVCPLLRREFSELTRDVFARQPLVTNKTVPAPLPENPPQLPNVNELSPVEVSTILKRRALYDYFLTEVERRAVAYLSVGVKVPDFALEPRSGHRKWTSDNDTVVQQLTTLGVKEQDCYTPRKVISPAQAEKLLPSDRRHLIEQFTEKPALSPVLVSKPSSLPALSVNA